MNAPRRWSTTATCGAVVVLLAAAAGCRAPRESPPPSAEMDAAEPEVTEPGVDVVIDDLRKGLAGDAAGVQPGDLCKLQMHLLTTNRGRLDAMREIGAGLDCSAFIGRVETVDLEGPSVRVLELASIIESKEAAGRPKDLVALPYPSRPREAQRLTRPSPCAGPAPRRRPRPSDRGGRGSDPGRRRGSQASARLTTTASR